MPLRALVIDPHDNVANLIGEGRKGDLVQCTIQGSEESAEVTLADDIPAYHKFARVDIPAGQTVLKYGMSIGRATRDIRRGEHVHVHNIESCRGRGDLATRQA
ncbi:MAG TPA: D-galactarate dehydratase [Planctomycetaceae bacterium]|nr:D-galactarate dehydratase [Planctomycetaceae bacterium]HIQ20415.1 D-galactarate dehydratase [Planctomycetota bacterium]